MRRPSPAINKRHRVMHQWILFMTKAPTLHVTPKSTEQNLIVHTGKSEAEVTNNERLRLRYCTVEANYWQTWSIARRLCDNRAFCWWMLEWMNAQIVLQLYGRWLASSLKSLYLSSLSPSVRSDAARRLRRRTPNANEMQIIPAIFGEHRRRSLEFSGLVIVSGFLLEAAYALHPSVHTSVCLSVSLFRACVVYWTCRNTIVPMCRLTGSRPALRRLAHSNLAVLAYVRC